MMDDVEDDDFTIYDQNDSNERRSLLQSPQSIYSTPKRKISSEKATPRPSHEEDEGLRITNWKESSVKEKKFLDFVASGNIEQVQEFLNKNKDFNINARIGIGGSDGETALHVAVSRGDEDMVRLLLRLQFIDIGDCVLTAARDGRVNIVNDLLDHIAYKEEPEDVGCPGSERFPDDMTPLIVAATYGHVGLIRQLLRRNHQIKLPHPPKCFCKQICRVRLDPERGLRASYERLRLYTALSSPAFICVAADDPILRSFQLYRELRVCALQDVALGASYAALASEVRIFGANFIACCRTNLEVEKVLYRKRGFKSQGNVEMPRLLLAMENGQKEFVAHPAAQHVLYTRWLGDAQEWSGRSLPIMTAHVLGRVFLLPMLAILNLIMPSNKLARRLSSPVNRLVNHVASYLIFLVLVFWQSSLNKKEASFGPASSGIEVVLVLYLVTIELNLFRLLFLQGFKRFCSHLWNCYDLVMMQLFWAWFSFWLIAMSNQEHLERKFWSSFHPALISEGFLATATILAFGRLLFLCQLHHKLGPMQVSLGKMTNDLAQCVVIFIIILISFSAGLCTLFQYYDGMVQVQPGTGAKLIQPDTFVDFLSTFKTLFWGMFGLTPPEYAVVVIENLPDNSVNSHLFTQSVASMCFALYMLLATVMIINVLVAKMTNTYQKVVDNVDIEWTFGKTEVFMTYMQQTVLPPPLNIIPTAAGILSVIHWFKNLFSKKTDNQAGDIEITEKIENDLYRDLMDTLSTRYFHATEEQEVRVTSSQSPQASSCPAGQEVPSINPQAIADIVASHLAPLLQHQTTAIREELVKAQTAAAQTTVAKTATAKTAVSKPKK